MVNAVESFKKELSHLSEVDRYRSLQNHFGTDFSSNDYLSFSSHPAIRQSLIKALAHEVPAGAGGSRLLRGHHVEHQELEEDAAQFFGREASLYFSSGFLANYALWSTLPSRHDAIVYDERIHASIKEGIRASFAESYTAKHNDVESYRSTIARAREKGAATVWIAVESLYSMDGDLTPLRQLMDLALESNSMLVLDEAHTTGIFGNRGRGMFENEILPGEYSHLITVHPCGKALGASGALIACDSVIRDYLINKARPFIYTTAPSPLNAIAISRGLELIQREPERREKLFALTQFARRELSSRLKLWKVGGDPRSYVIPIIIGEDRLAVMTAKKLQDGDLDVRAIRPPTVPSGTARLRVSIHTSLMESEILKLAEWLCELEGECQRKGVE